MKKQSQKRVDMYDIGEGLVLMNVITKNENGKMHQITTYIGIEGNGFVCVGGQRLLLASYPQKTLHFEYIFEKKLDKSII